MQTFDCADADDLFDFDYGVVESRIDSMEAFESVLLEPFRDPSRRIFYRGERINRLDRPLLPTLFRNAERLIPEGEYLVNIDSKYILNHYKSLGSYYELFTGSFGHAGEYRLYDLCAFSQHYMNTSPLIDFTKSLYVALSFGLKGKTAFEDDPILYTAEITDPALCTNDPVVAECWLHDYRACVINPKNAPDDATRRQLTARLRASAPTARMIDIATNDLMKYQQGAFMLLTDLELSHRLYLTKNVRSSLSFRKYILSKDICPALTALIDREAPWYNFSTLLDINGGIRTAVRRQRTKL